MWWLPETSGYSYLRVTAIRIDVHPVGENPTNTTCTLSMPVHIRSAYASCGWSPYMATFHEAPIDLDRSHCSREKRLSAQSIAHRLTDPWVRTQLLSWASQWRRGHKPSSWRWPTTRFTGPISSSCDWYIQYLLMGANRTVPNRHRWGYNHGGPSLPDTHSPTFPTSYPHFPLMAPPGLHFNQVSAFKPKCWVLKNLWPPRSLLTTRPSTVAYIYA
jgi:hypothetical protein